MRPVYLTGAGIHTALGSDAEHSIARLGTLNPPRRVPLRYGDHVEDIPYYVLADAPLEALEERLYHILTEVIRQAIVQADLDARERENLGLFLGTSSADVSVSEARFQRELRESDDAVALIASNSISNLAFHLRQRFGLRGPDFSFNTACTASANALMAAADNVALGHLDHALVVSVELFNVITAAGFQSLQLLASDAMRPFDRDRDGLVPGEGCSAVVVAAERRRPGAFRLLGGANLCDTHSMSSTNPDGSRVWAVMEQALGRAGIAPSAISALKVHGTASLHNDEAEVAGMRQVFDRYPPTCALKPYIGHTLGACGLNELVLFCAALERGFLPGTPGIASADRADLGVALNQTARPMEPGHFMLNYFGFGGNNTSVVVSNAE